MSAGGAQTLLFDLDGTLTDPFVGITTCIRHALTEMGQEAPPAEDLRWCIGPPLWTSFRRLLQTDDEDAVNRAVRFYRERFSVKGKFENVLIDGIPELLSGLHADGYAMAVATSKLESYAGDIVEHFGLMRYFDTVYGSEPEGRFSDKPDLLARIVGDRKIDPAATMMIGDRRHDVEGAHANHVRCVGVLWGYGGREELEGAEVDFIAQDPADLGAVIRKNLPMS